MKRRNPSARGPAPLLGALLLLAAGGAAAQPSLPGLDQRSMNDPVTFTADEVQFDQNSGVVSAQGRVEAWQGDRVLRADRFTYNRNTGVATAEGNVVLIEPDGNVLFADRAELSGGMRDAALEGLGGLLAANARVAAAGGRRTDGRITDLARVVYSPCNLCPEDPNRPPLWQLRARIASLHSDEQRVRYRDASLELAGWPLLYTPYLSHAAPGAQRVSGFLSPTFGFTRLLGAFWEQPFYWAIDGSQDAIISTTLGTDQAANLGIAWRRRFNIGEIGIDGSVGYLGSNDTDPGDRGWGWNIFSRGNVSIDENWRAGFTLNRASSVDYLRGFRYGSPQVLTSTGFVEGFWGVEGYARADTRWYQNTLQRTGTGQIPFVLPYGYAEWAFAPDRFGGRFSVDTQGYSILRNQGTDSRRIGIGAGYELPMRGRYGEIWTLRGRADLLTGFSQDLTEAPFFAPSGNGGGWVLGNARGALDVRWPLVRSAGEWGSHILEPRVQFVTGPQTGNQLNIPAEDSLDFEFSDANLFALNRFAGRDRQEGGTRMDAALRAGWLFPNGGILDGLVGQSFRTTTETLFPANSGLQDRVSDYVARARLAPVPWFEVIGRTRLDNTSLQPALWDLSATTFGQRGSLTVGYLNAPAAANGSYPERNEISAGAALRLTENWRLGGFGRYDIQLGRGVSAGASVVYEDECLVFETRFARRYAIDPTTQSEYAGSTILLFRVTLKTIGDFGIRAL